MKEYVKDSTKGSSRLEPESEKNDVLVQVWMSSKVLAGLCKWLDRKGEYSRFMSQVVRVPLEELMERLVEIGETEVVTTSESRKMLESRFGVKLNRGGRGKKNLLHNVVLDSKREDVDWSSLAYSPGVEKELSGGVVKEKMSREELRSKMGEIDRGDKVEDQALMEFLDRSKFERTENE